MHDVFHASLLHVHVPNDDCLFPGCMDTQLSIGNDSESKWAVEKIPSHSWSEENALFEVKWKAGDKTWLPYYQVSCDTFKFHPLQDISMLQHCFNSCQHLTFVNRIILLGRIQFCWVECSNLCHFPVAFLAHNTHNTSNTPIHDHPYLAWFSKWSSPPILLLLLRILSRGWNISYFLQKLKRIYARPQQSSHSIKQLRPWAWPALSQWWVCKSQVESWGVAWHQDLSVIQMS